MTEGVTYVNIFISLIKYSEDVTYVNMLIFLAQNALRTRYIYQYAYFFSLVDTVALTNEQTHMPH